MSTENGTQTKDAIDEAVAQVLAEQADVTLSDDERDELAEIQKEIDLAFAQYINPLQSAAMAILRMAERRLKLPRGSFGKTHQYDAQTHTIRTIPQPTRIEELSRD